MTTNKENPDKSGNNEIQLFVQGESIAEIQLVRISEQSTLGGLIKKLPVLAALSASEAQANEFIFLLEDSDRELDQGKTFKQLGIKNRDRIHIHRCRKIKVTVNFNGREASDSFPPSKTIAKVKRWADKEFKIDNVDATEHALQLCGTATRPDEDAHLGTLASRPNCGICFDLVPKKRVEGTF